MRRLVRYSVVGGVVGYCWLLLAGCATNGALQAPSATGNVKLFDAIGQPLEWPAEHVYWNDPASSLRGPFSKQLWDLGHRMATDHCFYLRDDGSPTRITVMGLVNARLAKNVRGLFGGQVSLANVEDSARMEATLVGSFMRDSHGDPDRVQRLLNESLAHDVKCLRLALEDYQARAELNEQSKALATDANGRQVVIGIVRSPDYYSKYLYWLRRHETEVRELRTIYEQLAQQLTNRVARASPPIDARPRGAAPSDRPDAIVAASKRSNVPKIERISVDTTPLRAHEREIAERIKAAKASCTLYARIDCGA